MKKLIITTVTTLIFASSANASTRIYNDKLGNTYMDDNSGYSARMYKGLNNHVHMDDNRGNHLSCYNDSLGNTYCD